MAKLKDILELQKAGFNADEIAKLLPLVEEKAEVQTIVKEVPSPVVEPVTNKDSDTGKVVDKLDELIKKIELNGVLSSQQPDKPKESLEEVMASIINPQ